MLRKRPSTPAQRRRFLESHAQLGEASVLEIGAMDAPTYPDRAVRYLDWFSREELLEMHGDNERRWPERIVDVDYVIKSREFAPEVPDRFDLVIANHVLEHVPDPITWLQQVERLATDDGALFLSLPDRRYTFDYLRPESTLVDLLRAHEEGLERASYHQVLTSLLYHRPIRAREAWAGDIGEALTKRRFSVPEAMKRARAISRRYSNVHCNVFTRDSFERVIADVADAGLTAWRLQAIDDVERDRNEFHALLRLDAAAGSSSDPAG
jgi:SAM-dependent methyltransferase